MVQIEREIGEVDCDDRDEDPRWNEQRPGSAAKHNTIPGYYYRKLGGR
jgi:hypothetical protein